MTEHLAQITSDGSTRWFGWECTCGVKQANTLPLDAAGRGRKMHADTHEADALRKQVRG